MAKQKRNNNMMMLMYNEMRNYFMEYNGNSS